MSRFPTNINRVGNRILVREYDGERHVCNTVRFKPKLYLKTNDAAHCTHKTLSGEPLKCKMFDTITDARNFVDDFKDVDGYDVYGTTNYIAQYISETYDKTIEFDIDKIRIFNIDIETISLELTGFPDPHDATHPIVTITLYDSFDKKYHVWYYGDFVYKPNPVLVDSYSPNASDIVVHKYNTEKLMLSSFVKFWEQNTPNVVTGWNIEGFDIPFIINRITRLLGSDEANFLSPWGRLSSITRKDVYFNDVVKWDIVGVSILDYLSLYKEYTYTAKPSYTLDSICEAELGAKKLDYSDVGTLKDLYVKDFQRFCDYNVRDVSLVQALDEKMGMLSLHITLSYYYKQPYNDTFSPVKTWETFIYHYLNDRGQLPIIKGSPKDKIPYPGGYVKEPLIGEMNSWVVSFDLNSLYPHLIMQYNIGPETMIKNVRDIWEQMSGDYEKNIQRFLRKEIDTSCLKEMNAGVAANGVVFSNEVESFLSSMMKMLYAERKAIKKDMLRYEQLLVDAKAEASRRGLL